MVTELNIESYVKEYAGSGGSGLNPELPDRDSLTLGSTVTFADKEWIVSHVTDMDVYLTLKGLSGTSSWNNLQYACTTFANSLTVAQRDCLKSVTADTTSGKVFVATKNQIAGGFRYFNSNSRRSVGSRYWTSTRREARYAYYVDPDGRFDGIDVVNTSTYLGFRPSVCINMILYE